MARDCAAPLWLPLVPDWISMPQPRKFTPQALPKRRSQPMSARAWAFGLAAACATAGGLALWQRQSGPAAPSAWLMAQPGQAVAVLAGGCFWSLQAALDAVPGVLATTVGYTGGHTANPSDAEVATQATGHAEAVHVVFDPTVLPYTELLRRYWRAIDPTVENRQFCDVGASYRTVIYTVGPEQALQAQQSKAQLEQNPPLAQPVRTAIEVADTFYPAGPQHQDFARRNPQAYADYRLGCGQDARLAQLWGALESKP